MIEDSIKHFKYDTVEASRDNYDCQTIKLRGFLNNFVYHSSMRGMVKHHIELIFLNKNHKRFRINSFYADNITPCRVVLFEKYIMDESKFIKPSLAIRRPRKRVSAKNVGQIRH